MSVDAVETAATTIGGAGGGEGYGGWRDRDPPPSFDGKEEKFKQFLRDWELWKHETEVPKSKHGTKLLRNLSNMARAVADELSVAEIVSEQGADKIIACLKVHFEPHLETAMPRAFEKAVYGESRRGRETFAEYIIRMEAAFRELAAESVKLEDNVTGYIIFRQANLTQVQEDQITTWTQGKYGKAEIVRALRRLEKVQKEKNGSRNYVTADAETFAVEEAADDEDSEDYVYLGDNDLNEIYEEEEVQEALNTYQQVRKAIKEQKVSRGFFNPKGQGKGYGKFKEQSNIKFSQRGAKVHVDVLKLRTRCAKCGQIGHWAKECSNEPDSRGKLRAEAASSKTGYCEVGQTQSSYWGKMSSNGSRITLGQFLRRKSSKNNVPSSFLMTQPEFGVVDTAAQGGLVGAAALKRLEGKLVQHGLAVRWTDKVAQARGIGGEAKVCGVVEIPISIAGVSCVIEATVVEDEVPLLLSVKFLREHDAVIDLQKQQLHFRTFQKTANLVTQKSGHVAVDVCDWQGNDWEVPEIRPRDDMRRMEFQCLPRDEAMRGSVSWWNLSSPRAYAISSHAAGSFDAATAPASGEGEDTEDGSGCWVGCTAGCSELGSGSSKGVRAHRPGGRPRKGWRLARKWIAVWFQCSMFLRGAQIGPILAAGKHLQGAAVQGGDLQGADQAWAVHGHQEVQDGSCGGLQGLRAQGDRLAGSWQPEPAGSVVQQMPPSVVGGPSGNDAVEGEEGKDHRGRPGVHEEPSGKLCQATYQVASGDAKEASKCRSTKDAEEPRHVSERAAVGEESSKFAGNPVGERRKCGDKESLQVWQGGHKIEGEEGGTHPGSALLQVCSQSVRSLRVGCHGSHGDQGGHDRERHEGEVSRGDETTGERHHDRGRAASPVCPATATSGISDSSGAHAQPAVVDDRGGRRRSPRTSDGEPPASRTNGPAGQSTQEEVGGRASSSSEQWQLLQDGGVVAEEKIEEILREAPWACELSNRSQWCLWQSMQIQEEELRSEERCVSPQFWMSDEAGSWKKEEGILPEFEEGRRAIGVFANEGQWMNDFEEEEAERSLSRASRKGVEKQLRKMRVGEVYSVPRVSQVAEEMGHEGAGAFDKLNGYDFTIKEHRVSCWKELRRRDPDVLVVCPPCGPFSMLQELNYPRMDPKRVWMKVAEGVDHINFAMQLFRWQVKRGRLALFEHPATSKAWKEEEVVKTLALPGVVRVRADQCEYGLNVEGTPNKKPTDFMVNGEGLARWLSKRCSGGHLHQPLTNGRAVKAQHYPRKLCQAMIKGAEEDSRAWRVCEVFANEEAGEDALERALDDEVEASGGGIASRPLGQLTGNEDAEEEEESEDARGVSREDRRLVQKLHSNLGHPSRLDFCRVLRMARARPAIWKYVRDEFKCDICEAAVKPKSSRPAAVPRNFEPCRTVGVDVVYFPAIDPNYNVAVLNVMDWGTGYQSLEPLDRMSSDHVWKKFYQCWVRIFGMPEMVVMDQGREFVGSFSKIAAEHGALVKVIGARAPWQQGRTERHGGLAKEIFAKVREEMSPSGFDEWAACVYAVEAAKNRLFNRSGFSPAQRQLGANIRLPGALATDDPLDPKLVINAAGESMNRTLAMRQSAMEAFLRCTSKEAVMRAKSARNRVQREFNPGDIVYVYRVPLRRKGDEGHRRPKWVGPGSVIMPEGANVWLNMRGELWKCAREQLRIATEDEQEAAGLLKEEFHDLKENLARKGSKRSFQDLSDWALPPAEDDPPVEETGRSREVRPRIEEAAENDEERNEETPAQAGEQESSSSSSETSTEEPEREEMDENTLDEACEVVRRNQVLDGVLRSHQIGEEVYGPIRKQMQRLWGPYRGGVTVRHEEEEDDEGRKDEDLWLYDEERNKIIRKHVVSRKVGFVPSQTRGCPIPMKHLTSHRCTVKQFEDGSHEVDKGNWREKTESKRSAKDIRWWVGYTEFTIRKRTPELAYMVKRGSDEVLEKDIATEEEWSKWRVADGAEWSKVEATGAVRTMTVEESEDVEAQLNQAGLGKRILPSRIVRRWKPAEQPGQPPTRKSRWCVRGDRDPDLLELVRHAPTVTTSTLSVVLQVAASSKWRGAVGDLKNAFMQSEKLVRPSGRLYCKQPSGGLPGLDPKQLIEILAGAYGLGDAPAHWRKTLRRAIFEMGMVQSVMDPCIFKWFKKGELQGLLVVEVDDLLMLGSSEFFNHLEYLRKRFEFGKFVFVDEQKDGTSFNGRRIRSDGKHGYQIRHAEVRGGET